MAEKKKVVRITTPAGIASYPKLQKADTKYNAAGVYSVKLILSNAASEDLRATLDAVAEEAFAAAKADPKSVASAKAKRKEIVKNEPYLPELDKEGAETGNTVFNFKTKASAVVKGETKFFKPFLCDASKPPKPIVEDISVWSGSIIRVNFSPAPYYAAANFQAGCTCYLNGVQIIKLVTGGFNAASLGFEGQEDGYEFADGTPAGPETAEGAPSSDTPASEF